MWSIVTFQAQGHRRYLDLSHASFCVRFILDLHTLNGDLDVLSEAMGAS